MYPRVVYGGDRVPYEDAGLPVITPPSCMAAAAAVFRQFLENAGILLKNRRRVF